MGCLLDWLNARAAWRCQTSAAGPLLIRVVRDCGSLVLTGWRRALGKDGDGMGRERARAFVGLARRALSRLTGIPGSPRIKSLDTPTHNSLCG